MIADGSRGSSTMACIASAPRRATAFDGAALPLVILPDGRRLEAPSLRELAEALGLQTAPQHDRYDVVIVGGGPAGLAAAVYGASEGLRTLLVERTACGGQAGTSSRIENYLGFPAGLSGDDLSAKARQQALRFDAELLVARSVVSIEPGDPTAPMARTTHHRPRRRHAPNDESRDHRDRRAVAPARHARHRSPDGSRRVLRRSRAPKRSAFAAAASTSSAAATPPGRRRCMFSSYAESVTMLVRGPVARREHVAVPDQPARDEGERDDRDAGRSDLGRGRRSARSARARAPARRAVASGARATRCSSSSARTRRRRGFPRS